MKKATDDALLSCVHARLGYEDQVVIDELDFSIFPGDYICVVGENGSGKSTLIKSLLGLIKPLRGEIRKASSIKDGSIGYLPQQTLAQKDFPATVMEVVLSGFLNECRHRPFYTKKERDMACQNMEKMRVLHLKKSCYRNLSGGQQQRVLLARALCAANKLLILDEPVTGLDPAAAMELYETLDYLNQKEGMAILMVSHDIQNSLSRVSKILHIGSGTHFYNSTEEYLQSQHGKKFAKPATSQILEKPQNESVSIHSNTNL